MTKHLVRALAVASFVFAADARAASPRVYLASNGANSGACTRTAPCLTFAYALAQVSPKGEIVVLDTSSHANFTVTKSVSIVAAPGAHVVVSAPSGTAVTVTIASADAVVLRGLAVSGLGTGNTGVRFNGQGSLHIEDCAVSGFTTHGIFQSNSGKMFVKDTTVRDGTGYGIRMYVNSGNIVGSIDNCRVENIATAGSLVGVGVGVGNNARVSISRTIASGNSHINFAVGGSGRVVISDSNAAGSTRGFTASDNGQMSVVRSQAASNGYAFYAISGGVMNIDRSVADDNGWGVFTTGGGDSIARVANSMIVNCGYIGLKNEVGTIISRGNNTVMGSLLRETEGTITYDTGPQ